jgi:hypothetical protein
MDIPTGLHKLLDATISAQWPLANVHVPASEERQKPRPGIGCGFAALSRDYQVIGQRNL